MINQQQLTKDTVIVQVEGNIVSDMDGEKVMLSIQNGKYYNLGEIGGEIWQLITVPISISNVIGQLQAQYEVETAECQEQVTAFVQQLLEEGLIEKKHSVRRLE
ncbi:hypothetical protein JCM9157_3084 [Halalkalibacter akibai JCM 9157]|uniref:Uncharacterized protein n=2 Tax=Halalkalibacter akibai TaxID=1411 RepID=W4QVN7_HALA3|nr:hypothetical protein JCM9157_3084 [Halalkalibacter akibai JCM 9157]